MSLIGFKKLHCRSCDKLRWHEVLMELGKCVHCNDQQLAIYEPQEPEPIVIERFV